MNAAPLDAFITVKHFANIGDIIATMPSCKAYYEATGRKIKFMQVVNQLAQYYQSAVHPTVNQEGQMVCVNDKMFEMVKPLIEAQEYIHSFVRYEGQEVNLDFDVIRSKTFVNLPHGMIQSWVFYAFPDLAVDLSKQWMSVPDSEVDLPTKGKIVLNFTERYRNHATDYFFLKKYSSDLIFAGTEREHWLFCNKWQLDIQRLEVDNFLEYAQALKQCRYFLGNQSFAWNLCQAMHIPRILEVCQFAANCMPFIGEYSYGFYHQTGVEYYFRKLYNVIK